MRRFRPMCHSRWRLGRDRRVRCWSRSRPNGVRQGIDRGPSGKEALVGAVPTIELLDGRTLPRLGLGTWPLDDDEAYDAVGAALERGYRLIDSAARYDNERGVGRAVADSGVSREEI